MPCRLIIAALLFTLACAGMAHAAAGLMVRCDPEAEVWLNGKKIGACPGKFAPKAGKYTLELKMNLNGALTTFYKTTLDLADATISKVDAGVFSALARDMVKVKGGCFQMGDTFGDGNKEEKPVHEVCVDGFSMGKYEMTVGQFRAFVEETGYVTDAEKNTGGDNGCWTLERDSSGAWSGGYKKWASWRKPLQAELQPVEEQHPVSCVSWNDVAAFIAWLNRNSGRSYRLPTEAEWEYAARAGTSTRNYWGNGKNDACRYANVADQSPLPSGSNWPGEKHECNDGYTFVAPVGRFQPNTFGLYDMIGNVWEWTADWYGSDYYGQSPKQNPQGPISGSIRVNRGGSCCNSPAYVRAANRSFDGPAYRDYRLGFRLVAPVQ